ncbi:hypothetical protein MKK75_00605 [Methylobacterium sp. J-030]|uniref:DUF6644 family protein n=1 Tax=Methylobacterium sp. J-030 TaxID=2836627 RepID=UPI001FBA1651|nr:DUF6644 family protein [Methylobacterium sp. J-030]MCJ2067321.1 hypothetical protein [Methylobacterium sp. J-030]
MTFRDLIALLENSSIAEAIREGDWLFPSIESVHVIAICATIGSIFILDLRLLNMASRDRPVINLARSVLPLTWIAFVIAATTGFLLFISNASRYLANGYFDTKLVLIALAGANMLVFHFLGGRDLTKWVADARPPSAGRIAGALSIALWVAVVICGRMIGFTMDPT